MSLSHNQNLTLESHTTPGPLQLEDTRGSSKQFEMQAALIPEENRFEYESAAKLLSIVKSTANSGSAEEYFLYFHGVTHDRLRKLDRAFHDPESDIRCTLLFTTENSLQDLICRILPGGRHNTLIMNLLIRITSKVAEIPGHTHRSISTISTARRFYLGDIRSKEELGYQDLGPTTCMAKGDWPPAVIEVGYSEAFEFLHLDTEWLLINSSSAT